MKIKEPKPAEIVCYDVIVFAFWASDDDDSFVVRLFGDFVRASMSAFANFAVFFDFRGAREDQIVSERTFIKDR